MHLGSVRARLAAHGAAPPHADPISNGATQPKPMTFLEQRRIRCGDARRYAAVAFSFEVSRAAHDHDVRMNRVNRPARCLESG
jgi:hypothetical protein